MLKKRVAAALLIKDGILVQSIGFKKYLPVGTPEIAAEFLNYWGIDEIILLDISASKGGKSISQELVKKVASKCFVPLIAGGGISTLEEVDHLIRTGADKISINNISFTNPEFITHIAKKYGDQCVVAAIDVHKDESGKYTLYDYINKNVRKQDLITWVKQLEKLGAGELLVNTVDKDGTYTGFDVDLVNLIAGAVSIPVIALGGAGNASHFSELFKKSKAAAGCAGNFFNFTEHSVITTKRHLLENNINVRLETHADYEGASFDKNFRLAKKADKVLEEMLFIKIEKEII